MRRFVDTLALLMALAATLATASACTLRFDGDDLRGDASGRDGGVHVGPDAAPGALHLQPITAELVFEGQTPDAAGEAPLPLWAGTTSSASRPIPIRPPRSRKIA
jgi:hypothetical protein